MIWGLLVTATTSTPTCRPSRTFGGKDVCQHATVATVASAACCPSAALRISSHARGGGGRRRCGTRGGPKVSLSDDDKNSDWSETSSLSNSHDEDDLGATTTRPFLTPQPRRPKYAYTRHNSSERGTAASKSRRRGLDALGSLHRDGRHRRRASRRPVMARRRRQTTTWQDEDSGAEHDEEELFPRLSATGGDHVCLLLYGNGEHTTNLVQRSSLGPPPLTEFQSTRQLDV